VTSGHCPIYAKEQDHNKRPEWVTRVYASTRWKHLREWKRRHNPLCEYCEEDDKQEPVTSVDHVIPLAVAPDRGLDPKNLRSSCWRHQRAKQ
jgi:5-methylcytosine-specific restriction endonuclease McrA